MPDDTTDTGAFYATNHFINSLEKRFPKIKFVIANIDTAIASDSMAITWNIESIEKIKKLDLRKFCRSELGYDVQKDSADAMIIGKIDSCAWRAGLTITGFRVYKSRILSCYFTYYLISLKDGRVLWKASTLGEEGYTSYFGAEEIYPPLDYALSNGIDLLIFEIPLE
jgi:hypothetical protein